MRRLSYSIRLIVAILGALLPIASNCSADTVIYNNFGPGDAFKTTAPAGYLIFGTNLPTPQSIAEPFTLGASDLFLSTITVAVGSNGGGLNGDLPFNINVVTDSGGLPSNTILESFDGLIPNGDRLTAYTPETVMSVLRPELLANTSYWLEVAPGNPNVGDAWNLNTAGATGLAGNGGSGWFIDTSAAAAFRVSGTNVPEPGSLGLISGLGIATMGLLVRRRQRMKGRV